MQHLSFEVIMHDNDMCASDLAYEHGPIPKSGKRSGLSGSSHQRFLRLPQSQCSILCDAGDPATLTAYFARTRLASTVAGQRFLLLLESLYPTSNLFSGKPAGSFGEIIWP